MHRLLAALFVALPFTACRVVRDYSRPLEPGAPALIPLAKDEERPDFMRDFVRRDEILPALERSIAWTQTENAKRFFPIAGIEHERALASLVRFRDLLESATSPQQFAAALDREFIVYKSAGWDSRGGGVLFTAYCTPILQGRRQPEPGFGHPLYALPPDLVKNTEGEILGRRRADGTLEPYPDRRAIEANHLLEGQNLELVWLADPLDAFIAHVNGSAFIEVGAGEMIKLGYAGKNGHDYTSLGGELVRAGVLTATEVSLPSIRAWGKAHPDELQHYLVRNASYVFFTPIEGTPRGCLNFEVEARRSIATDKTIFPRAALCWVEAINAGGKPSFSNFMFDQDRGGAIRTAGRADLYLGIGDEAEREAGIVKAEGQLYYLFLAPERAGQTTLEP